MIRQRDGQGFVPSPPYIPQLFPHHGHRQLPHQLSESIPMITASIAKLSRVLEFAACVAICLASSPAKSEQWVRHELSRDFYSEGGACADFDKDGHIDLVAGPIVYYGPDFQTKSTIQEAKPYSINGYSNNFLCYANDLNGDGWMDVVIFDFPGAQTWYLQNPGKIFGLRMLGRSMRFWM